MNKIIPSPKAYAIRNFLSHCVRMQGNQPVRLMTEEALCQKFSVNRETVRNAIKDLLRSGALLRIPGKKGIYSNPLFSNSDTKHVGLVNGRPGEPYIHPSQAHLFAKTVEKFGLERQIIFQFPPLSESPEQTLVQLPHYAFDLTIWMHFSQQHDFWIDTLDSLIRGGCPIIIVNMLNNGFAQKASSSNMIGFDLRGLAEKKARFLAAASKGKLLYVSDENPSQKFFLEAFRRENPSREIAEFNSRGHTMSELTGFLKKEMPESIFCEGGADRYKSVLQAVSSDAALGKIRCFLAENMESAPLTKVFPALNLSLSTELDYSKEKMADELAGRMHALLSDPKASFKNILIS